MGADVCFDNSHHASNGCAHPLFYAVPHEIILRINRVLQEPRKIELPAWGTVVSANFDVFNGDADGICALHQLRLTYPVSATLITGAKRDIKLLEKVEALSTVINRDGDCCVNDQAA